MLDTPVLFLIFNRPDLTERVFEKIKEARPAEFFIASDGPRKEKPGEAALCEEARSLVIKNIDWPCKVNTLFRNENLGCKIAVSEAITWFFNHVEEGIILEDDTLPHSTFFKYCQELLKKFSKDESIMHISGNNFQMSTIGNGSYYLSRLPHIWGWATWKRAWNYYDIHLNSFTENDDNKYFDDIEIDLFWKNIFNAAKKNKIDTWDYQWTHVLFHHNFYAIAPQYNLVKNIGFDTRSLRTSSPENFLANLKTYEIDGIIHPGKLSYNKMADINFQKIFNWCEPIYENRISGLKAARLLMKIFKKKLFS